MENVCTSVMRLIQVNEIRPVCGIVYSPRRVLCDDIAARFNADGIAAAAYHAGLETKDREKILNDWVKGNKLGVVVATMAFGMGVDRGDVFKSSRILLMTGPFCNSR